MTATSKRPVSSPVPPLVLLLVLVLVGCGGFPEVRAGGSASSTPSLSPESTPSPSPDSTMSPSPDITKAPSLDSTAGAHSPSSSAASPTPTRTRATSWRAVALGDSVTAGTNCSCTAFPKLYADEVSRLRGVPTSVANEGFGGLTSTQMLDELDQPSSEQAQDVAAADIDLVTIGANDFSDQHGPITDGRCAGTGDADCVQDELARLKVDLTAILQRIHTLRRGRPTAVLVTGYWNVFEDGQVARDTFPDPGLAATRSLTRQANRVIREVTVSLADTYVDLYLPFNGPEAGGDVSSLLASDGDHPNARGHAVIAHQLVAAGLNGLEPL